VDHPKSAKALKSKSLPKTKGPIEGSSATNVLRKEKVKLVVNEAMKAKL